MLGSPLYTIIPPLIVYAVLGTSRVLVVGSDTATGLISALTVGAIAAQGTAQFDTLTSTLAILIGALFPVLRRVAHGLGSCLYPHAGDAGIHRRPRDAEEAFRRLNENLAHAYRSRRRRQVSRREPSLDINPWLVRNRPRYFGLAAPSG